GLRGRSGPGQARDLVQEIVDLLQRDIARTGGRGGFWRHGFHPGVARIIPALQRIIDTSLAVGLLRTAGVVRPWAIPFRGLPARRPVWQDLTEIPLIRPITILSRVPVVPMDMDSCAESVGRRVASRQVAVTGLPP